MQEILFFVTSIFVPLALVLFIAILRWIRGVDPLFGPDLIAIMLAVDSSVMVDSTVVLPRISHPAIAQNLDAALALALLVGIAAIILTISWEGKAAVARRQNDEVAHIFWVFASHAPMAAYIVAHFYVTTYPTSFWSAFG